MWRKKAQTTSPPLADPAEANTTNGSNINLLPSEILHHIFSFDGSLKSISDYSNVDQFWRDCALSYRFDTSKIRLLRDIGLSYKYQICDQLIVHNSCDEWENLLFLIATCRGFKEFVISKLPDGGHADLMSAFSRNTRLEPR
jgi:hypothetical protein